MPSSMRKQIPPKTGKTNAPAPKKQEKARKNAPKPAASKRDDNSAQSNEEKLMVFRVTNKDSRSKLTELVKSMEGVDFQEEFGPADFETIKRYARSPKMLSTDWKLRDVDPPRTQAELFNLLEKVTFPESTKGRVLTDPSKNGATMSLGMIKDNTGACLLAQDTSGNMNLLRILVRMFTELCERSGKEVPHFSSIHIIRSGENEGDTGVHMDHNGGDGFVYRISALSDGGHGGNLFIEHADVGYPAGYEVIGNVQEIPKNSSGEVILKDGKRISGIVLKPVPTMAGELLIEKFYGGDRHCATKTNGRRYSIAFYTDGRIQAAGHSEISRKNVKMLKEIGFNIDTRSLDPIWTRAEKTGSNDVSTLKGAMVTQVCQMGVKLKRTHNSGSTQGKHDAASVYASADMILHDAGDGDERSDLGDDIDGDGICSGGDSNGGSGKKRQSEPLTHSGNSKVLKTTSTHMPRQVVDSIECLNVNAPSSENLGGAGGGTVKEKNYDAQACCVKASETAPGDADSWFYLGNAGGGKVNGKEYDTKACYVEALKIAPGDADSWFYLGNAGGGKVNGKEYDKKACYVKALEYDLQSLPKVAASWSNLGRAGGGTVKGKEYGEGACYLRASEITEEIMKILAGIKAKGYQPQKARATYI